MRLLLLHVSLMCGTGCVTVFGVSSLQEPMGLSEQSLPQASRDATPPSVSEPQASALDRTTVLTELINDIASYAAAMIKYTTLQENDFDPNDTLTDKDRSWLATKRGQGSADLDRFIDQQSGEKQPFVVFEKSLERFTQNFKQLKATLGNDTLTDRDLAEIQTRRTECRTLKEIFKYMVDQHAKPNQ